MIEYIIYRDKVSNRITSYSKYQKVPENLEKLIAEYNLTEHRKGTAERVVSDDIKSLIEISEANKLLKDDDIRSIEQAMDNLQNEVWLLKENRCNPTTTKLNGESNG